MGRPWSKLQKEFYLLRADGLDLQLHCRAYRMDSQMGSTDIPRYWITLGKEIIWDYPRDFIEKNHPKRVNTKWYPYGNDVPDISNLIREYIDTPKDELMSKNFQNDHWGLINIFRASDKRIGLRRLPELKRKTKNRAALKVIETRLESTKSSSR
ncbi:SF0329 family protein [Microbulbifer sp. JMSA008]|uniref:SF0329 family protein n=1 Tax=Microbulbifer sp. JMSA008 TaxID=3243373 RepID=UPI004039E19E